MIFIISTCRIIQTIFLKFMALVTMKVVVKMMSLTLKVGPEQKQVRTVLISFYDAGEHLAATTEVYSKRNW